MGKKSKEKAEKEKAEAEEAIKRSLAADGPKKSIEEVSAISKQPGFLSPPRPKTEE